MYHHLLGDFNINADKWRQLGGEGAYYQCLVDDLYSRIISKGITQTVTKKTRHYSVQRDSRLDLHFTSSPDLVGCTRVSNSTSSDHCGIIITRKTSGFKNPNQMRGRSLSKVVWGVARNHFWLMDMRHLFRINDANEVCNRLTSAINLHG